LSKAPIGTSCPDSEKMCGKDPDTFFCVPQESNCPILHINVDKITGELTYVNSENEEFKQPIVEFRISEDAVCL
jgi:hypothetical protein